MSKPILYSMAVKLTSQYSIPLAPQVLAKSESELKKLSHLHYPLAMKVISRDIIHKSDAGLVRVNVHNEEEVKKHYEAFQSIIAKNFPKAEIEGILFQEMVKGIELIVGVNKDPTFGHVIMFGLGGIFVEVLKDVSFRVTPVSQTDAMSMIQDIKSYKILTGLRGQEPVDIHALAKIIVSLSHLVEDHPEIEEIDLNPIFAQGKTIVAADLRILTADGFIR